MLKSPYYNNEIHLESSQDKTQDINKAGLFFKYLTWAHLYKGCDLLVKGSLKTV